MIRERWNIKTFIVLFLIGGTFLLFARYAARNTLPASDGPLSDMLLQMAPQRYFTDMVLDGGGRPMWNPFTGIGNDEATTLWYHPLYPTTHLTRFFGLSLGMNIELFLHLLLAFWGMYFYLKKLGLSFHPSTFGGVAFAGCGIMTSYCFAPSLPLSSAYFPIILWAFEQLLQKRSLLYGGILGLLAGLHTLEGMVQYTLYFAIFIAFYMPVRVYAKRNDKGLLKLFSLLILASILAALISAGRIIPWIVNLERMRGGYGEYGLFAQYLFNSKALLTIFAPKLFEASGGVGRVDLGSFIGIAPVVMAVIALVRAKKNLHVTFFLVSLVLSVAFIVDWPLVRWLWNGNQTFASLTPNRFWIIGAFAIAALSAFGVGELVEDRKALLDKKMSILGGILGAVLTVIMVGAVAVTANPESVEALPVFKSVTIVLFVFALVFSSFFIRSKEIKGGILIFAVAINALFAFWTINPARHISRVYADTPITEALKGKQGRLLRIGRAYSFIQDDRVYEAKGFLINRVHDLHTLDLMPDPRLYEEYEKAFGGPEKHSLMYYRRTRLLPPSQIDKRDQGIMDRLKVRFLLVNGKLSHRIPIASDGRFNLYDKGITNYPVAVSFGQEGERGEAKWSEDFNSISISITSGQKTKVELFQSYRDGWKAYVDKTPVKTYTKDGLSILVDVPPGAHEVLFRFEAPYVKTGDYLTIFGYIFSLFCLLPATMPWLKKTFYQKPGI